MTRLSIFFVFILTFVVSANGYTAPFEVTDPQGQKELTLKVSSALMALPKIRTHCFFSSFDSWKGTGIPGVQVNVYSEGFDSWQDATDAFLAGKTHLLELRAYGAFDKFSRIYLDLNASEVIFTVSDSRDQFEEAKYRLQIGFGDSNFTQIKKIGVTQGFGSDGSIFDCQI